MDWIKKVLRVVATTPWGAVIALIGGAVWPLAFAPYGYWPVSIFSLLLLFSSWVAVSPGRAFWRGYLFGLGMFGFGVTWVHISIHTFGGVPQPMSSFITALFVGFLALFPASTGYLVSRACGGLSHRSMRWYWVGALPAVWVFGELIRGWVFSGFPWLNIGYSHTDGPLRGIAPLLGVYGVSWAAALVAGLFMAMLCDAQRRMRVRFAVQIFAIFLLGFLFDFVPWTQPIGDPLRVALVQGNIPQDMKWDVDLRQPTIDLYSNLSAQNAADTDLIVWPETALPDFFHRQEEFLFDLKEKALATGTDYLIGVLYMDAQTNRYFNSMVSVGSAEGVYHKRHLVPFTEYLPMKGVLGAIVKFMRVPMSDFTPGDDDQPTITVAGQPVGISICFEDAFGEEVRKSLPEATLLVNVSNDAWFGTSNAPAQHLQIARMRAIESGRPLLRGTNTGVTAITDHKGRINERAPQFEATVLRASVQPMRGETPFILLGNTPVWLGVMVVFGLCAWRVRRDRG